jgi:hypothetical protein
MNLRVETQRQVIARLLLLGWTAERIARKLHCTSRAVRYAISTDEFQTVYAELKRDHLSRVDRQMSALLLGAVDALGRLLKHQDWRARDAALQHILRIHGKYIDKIDITSQVDHSGRIQHAHDHLGRFMGLPEGPMTDELRVKTRELLAAVRKMREPKALPARLTDPSITNGHAHDGDVNE